MQILTFTSLYPNCEQPRHGIFIENRVRQLRHYYPEVSITVVAPVPWFPLKHKWFGGYSTLARVPRQDERHGVTVHYPRYLVLPKIGMNLAPWLMAKAMLPFLKRLIRAGQKIDLLDAHFFYPDGVVATLLGKQLGIPVAVTARGSDIHLYPTFPYPKRAIQQALDSCAQPIAVCHALADEMTQLSPSKRQVLVARNGVDLKWFHPAKDRPALRDRLGMRGNTLLSVGNLIELKGHHLIIDALKLLPNFELIIIGNGPMAQALVKQAKRSGVDAQVRFTGLLNQAQLREYYQAADALVLASSREGWANVLLEAMACGTPVVATAIWGTPEVVASDDAGVLIHDRSHLGIAQAVQSLFAKPPSRENVRSYATGFSWQQTCQTLYEQFGQLSMEMP